MVVKKHLLYYAFDIDDNLLKMPTKLRLVNNKSGFTEVSTDWYALNREKIGKTPIKFGCDTIIGYAENIHDSFIYFSDAKKLAFKRDYIDAIKNKKFAPAWSDFIEAILNGSIFAIVTARGHSSNTIREMVEYVIFDYLNHNDREKIISNLKSYNTLFKKNQTQNLISDYLDKCLFVGVAHPDYYDENIPSEKQKYMVLKKFIKKIEEISKKIGIPAKLGFSDDDIKNIKSIESLFESNSKRKYSNIVEYVIKNTKSNNKIIIKSYD